MMLELAPASRAPTSPSRRPPSSTARCSRCGRPERPGQRPLQAAPDAIDANCDRAGGRIGGAIAIEGPSASPGEDVAPATLRVRFTAGEGFADLFEDLKEDDAAVGIRNAGGGPLFTGSSTALTSSIRMTPTAASESAT